MEWKSLESNWKNGALVNIVKRHAPVFWFHSEEQVFPMDVETYLNLCELSHTRNDTKTTQQYSAKILMDPKFYQNKKKQDQKEGNLTTDNDWQGWSLSALHDDPSVFRFGKHENLSVHLKDVRLLTLPFFYIFSSSCLCV